MELGRYRLVEPIGAGRDGSSYQARSQVDESLVELRVLTRARIDVGRWKTIAGRLRTARLIDHSSAIRMVEFTLDPPAPIVVLEIPELPTLAEHLAANPLVSLQESTDLARSLVEAVDVGHRLGLPHGRLCPTTILVDPERGPLLDWTGVETDAAAQSQAEVAAGPCRPPGQDRSAPPSLEADRYALGALVAWIITRFFPVEGRITPLVEFPGLSGLVSDLMATSPVDRASAHDALRRLSSWRGPIAATQTIKPESIEASATQALSAPVGNATMIWTDADVKTAPLDGPPLVESRMLGRFRLVEKLGQGGMGAVFRAEDLSDGSIVAIKTLSPAWANRPDSLKRFLKEARLLSQVSSPFVTNFMEVNNDQGTYFLVLEYVAGADLTTWINLRGKMDEATAIAIAADIAKALGVAHERGIVHRDVKPDNILVVAADSQDSPGSIKVKLSDFGIAKAFEGRETTALTKVGTLLGTPLYMAPEQCMGGELGPWSDVYSLGATLFHLLSGRPPFLADTVFGLIHRHQSEAPPLLRSLNPDLSEGVEQVVKRCLAKRKEDRYADAMELLSDLERLLRGEPTGIAVHPLLPEIDHQDVVHYDWTWNLKSPPEKLWPHVSNTERLNRAVGIPSVVFQDQADADGFVERFGTIRKAGMEIAWREHPFEWVEGRRMGVLREYTSGPFAWFASIVELEGTAEGGTLLTHRIRIVPKGLIGKGLAAIEIGSKGRRAAEAVYRRIDAAVSGQLGQGADADPFEAPVDLAGESRRRFDLWLQALGRFGLDPSMIETLGDYVARAPVQEVARIRPIALARRLNLDPDSVINACLIGAKEGVLVLHWDLICPICRVPSQMIDSLRSLKDHGSCPACRSDFRLDFAQSVELVFRLHPEIRPTDLGTYCLGGPASAPHVVAQVRIAPHERLSLELSLPEGSYRLRGPQLPFRVDFTVEPGAVVSRWELDLARGPEPHLATRLKPRGEVLTLVNSFEREVLVRIERTAPTDDALTAARASSMSLFRTLFPGELLEPGRLINLATITLLVTDLPEARSIYRKLGDAAAFARFHEQFRRIDELARREGGSLVKTLQEGMILAFDDARSALRTALAIPETLRAHALTAELLPRIGIHRGPAMVATLNDHLDYFGETVRLATALPSYANPGGVVLPSLLAADPALAEIIAGSGRRVDVIHAELEDLSDGFIYRIGMEPKPVHRGRAAVRSS